MDCDFRVNSLIVQVSKLPVVGEANFGDFELLHWAEGQRAEAYDEWWKTGSIKYVVLQYKLLQHFIEGQLVPCVPSPKSTAIKSWRTLERRH